MSYVLFQVMFQACSKCWLEQLLTSRLAMWLYGAMPERPPIACGFPGCPDYAVRRGRCEKHQAHGWTRDKRSRHERGYGTAWDHKRRRVLKRDSYLCQLCLEDGRPVEAKHVDHIVAKAFGGSDDESNLQSLCVDCHKKKTAKEGVEARRGMPF